MINLDHVLSLGSTVFSKRSSLLSLWQEIAENFYPERADFTSTRYVGAEFGSDLMSSFPVLARRDLGDALSAMLRPTAKSWFHIRTKRDWHKVGTEARAWLSDVEDTQRRAMYDRKSNFVRAVKEADHDFVTFGQAVIQITLNKNANGLLFRCHHLRDTAWLEDENGVIDTVFRTWKPTFKDVVRLFPKTAHAETRMGLEKDPFQEMEVWHVVMPPESCGYAGDGKSKKEFPFISMYIDVNNKVVLEEVPLKDLGYIIPRWRTVSGTQYAISPATCVALPDARMAQSMLFTILEAGEKAVNPPMVASKQIFGGSFSLYSGGLTWADIDDGRIQDSFRTVPLDSNGIPFGRDMLQDVQVQITNAFYVNKLNLPPAGVNMTAFEVGERIHEHIRQVMPLFEPIEDEYNAPMCDKVFEILMRVGAFGRPDTIPADLHGKEVVFAFESPLHDAIDKAKTQQFLAARDVVVSTAQVAPEAMHVMDITKGLRDALQSGGTPPSWLRSELAVQQMVDVTKAEQANAQALVDAQGAADVSKTQAEAESQSARSPYGN